MMPAPIRILRMDHVGVMVPDIDRAVEWYAATLGLAVIDRWEDRDTRWRGPISKRGRLDWSSSSGLG